MDLISKCASKRYVRSAFLIALGLVALVGISAQGAVAAGPTPSFSVQAAGPSVSGLQTPNQLADVLLGPNVSLKQGTEAKVNLQTAAQLPNPSPACSVSMQTDPKNGCSPLPSFGRFSNGTTDLGIADGLIISSNAGAASFGTASSIEDIAANRAAQSVISYDFGTRVVSFAPNPVAGNFSLEAYGGVSSCTGVFGPYPWNVTAATIQADFAAAPDSDCNGVTVTGSVEAGFAFGGTAAAEIDEIGGVNNSLVTGLSDAEALAAVTTAAGLGGLVNNTTSLSFELEPPAPGEGRYLKFDYSLLVTETGNWNGSAWSGFAVDFPDGFALFTGGNALANNCSVAPQTSTYLSMISSGIVPPRDQYALGRAEAEARLAARIANPSAPNGFAYSTGELIGGAWLAMPQPRPPIPPGYSNNSNWTVQFLTVPLTCVYDASAELAAGGPVSVEIVIGDLDDADLPTAGVFKGSSVRWSNTPTPNQEALLEVTKSGTGSGTVASEPAGINCGDVCSANFTLGSKVKLTATPASGSTFTGWSGGGCSGTGTCEVTMSEARTVDAAFTSKKPKLKVTIGGPKMVLAGRNFTVGVRTTNQGSKKPTPVGRSVRAAKATSVKTCLKVPTNLFVVKAQKGAKTKGKSICWTRSSLGTSKWVSYKVTLRSSPSFGGSESFQATANAKSTGGATVSAKRSSKVQVREPKPAPKPEPPTG